MRARYSLMLFVHDCDLLLTFRQREKENETRGDSPTGCAAAAASSPDRYSEWQTSLTADCAENENSHTLTCTHNAGERLRYARFHWSVSSTANENRWLIIWSSLRKLFILMFARSQDLFEIINCTTRSDVHRHRMRSADQRRLCISITVCRNRNDPNESLRASRGDAFAYWRIDCAYVADDTSAPVLITSFMYNTP